VVKHLASLTKAPHAWVALALGCYSAQWFASHATTSLSFAVFFFSNLCGLGCIAYCALSSRVSAPSFSAVLIWALLLRIAAACLPPYLEDDYFRFLWDGFRTLTAGTPYGTTPLSYFETTAVPTAMRAVLERINYPELPTIYGPSLQWLFALGAWLDNDSPTGLRVLITVADCAVIATLRIVGISNKASLLYAWNPFVLLQGVTQIHFDALAGLLLLLLVLLLQRRRFYSSGFIWALLAGTKLPLALLVAPVVAAVCFKSSIGDLFRWLLTSTCSLALLYCSFCSLTTPFEWTALQVFAKHWQFNASLYALLSSLLNEHTARYLCGILIVLVSCGCGAGILLQKRFNLSELPIKVLFILTALLLLSPVVNSWYLLWLLPLCTLLPNRGGTWLACAALLLAHGTAGALNLNYHDPFHIPLGLRLVEYSLLILAIVRITSEHFTRSFTEKRLDQRLESIER
jgi:alpha-1,6-mannosyltransferase